MSRYPTALAASTLIILFSEFFSKFQKKEKRQKYRITEISRMFYL